MKVQRYLLVILFALCSFVLSACSTESGAKITEESVRNMLTQMEQAAVAHDVGMLTKHIAADATITFDLPAAMGGKQEISLGDYKEMLTQGWSMPATYTYEVKDIQVSVASDGMSATATDVTIETVEMDGQMMSTETNERLEITADNGKPIITSIYGKLKM